MIVFCVAGSGTNSSVLRLPDHLLWILNVTRLASGPPDPVGCIGLYAGSHRGEHRRGRPPRRARRFRDPLGGYAGAGVPIAAPLHLPLRNRHGRVSSLLATARA